MIPLTGHQLTSELRFTVKYLPEEWSIMPDKVDALWQTIHIDRLSSQESHLPESVHQAPVSRLKSRDGLKSY